MPAQSLLLHALASPNVVKGANGADLADFPTLAEIAMVENYVYGVKPPSLLELRARAQGALMAIVVFASEYRPAPETVHRKHANMCFSRTGVARVGTADPLYEPRHRGFLPFVYCGSRQRRQDGSVASFHLGRIWSMISLCDDSG
jgi:hypothetical protein